MAPRRNVSQNRAAIECRRQLVQRYYFEYELPYTAIVERLKSDGIDATKSTVARDVDAVKATFSQSLNGFDARVVIGQRLAMLRAISARALNGADRATKPSEVIGYLKVALDASEKGTALLQRVGLLPNQLGTVDLKSSHERIPSGEELQDWLETVGIVHESDLAG